MYGNAPSGWAPRISASASTNESVAIWEAEQRRLGLLGGVTVAAAPPVNGDAAAVDAAPRGSGEEPPQLHQDMPGSQVVGHSATTSSLAHTAIFVPHFQPVNAASAATAAKSVLDRDCVDHHELDAFRGPPVPPPNRIVPFCGTPLNAPPLPSSSLPRPTPMTPTPPASVHAAAAAAPPPSPVRASSSFVPEAPQGRRAAELSATGLPWTISPVLSTARVDVP